MPAVVQRGCRALVVSRFDGTRGETLRLEDCAQILCTPRWQHYAYTYDAVYQDIAAIINRHSARPTTDLVRFHCRLIVFALVGNCDAHLKNFSRLETLPAFAGRSPGWQRFIDYSKIV